MQLSKRAFAAALVSLLVTAGCAPPQQTGQTTTTTQATPGSAGTSTVQSAAPSALPPVNPPFPGPYQTVLIDGAELKQGRFPPGQYGGTLVRSIIGAEPKVFNPWTSNDTQSSELAALMFSGLVDIDPYTGDVIPSLAKEFKIEPDGVTYITRLRKGLKWSDGKPITAHDVAFTWNTIIKEGYGNASLRDVTTIDGKSPTVSTVDELTNKFVTPKPFAPFARLLGMPIAPRHVIEPIISRADGRRAFQRLWAAETTNPRELVTSGPYVLSRYVVGQRVEFVPTKNYFMVDKQGRRLPYIAKLIYQIVPEPNTNLMKFKAQEIDITRIRSRDTVDMMREQEAGNFKLYNLGQDIGTTFLMFNMNRRKNPETGKPYVNPVKSVWFNDVNFRQAVNHALNRDNMVANYFKGIGFPLFTSEPPSSPYYNSSLKGFRHDPAYAMSLLEKSGFKKRADGFLYDKDGNMVEFDMLANSGSSFTEAIGPMIKEDLKKLGMKVNFSLINFNTLNDKTSRSLDWEAGIFALSPGDPLEPNDGANVYKSDGRLHLFDLRLADAKGVVRVTDARPWEKRLDEIFRDGALTLDKTKRKQLYDEYQQIIYEQAPFIYLVSSMVIVGARNTLANYQPTQLSQRVFGLHNLEEMYKK